MPNAQSFEHINFCLLVVIHCVVEAHVLVADLVAASLLPEASDVAPKITKVALSALGGLHLGKAVGSTFTVALRVPRQKWYL